MITVAVTAVVVILTVSILIVIILLAVLRRQKHHSPSSNMVDKNVATSTNKVLNMKENANYYVVVEQNKTQYKNMTSV